MRRGAVEEGIVSRIPVAWATAVVLLVEALGVLAVAAVLASVIGGQHMSLAGLEPSAMSAGAWAGCGAAALFLVVCGAILARTAARDRAPGRAGRVTLIVCAVVHAVLGAVTASLVGWAAFAFMMAVLGLLVWVLLGYGRAAPAPAAP